MSQTATMSFDDAFERNPKICGGQTVLRGTRVPLRTVLASLAEGASSDDIRRNFPTLTAEHLRAANRLRRLLRPERFAGSRRPTDLMRIKLDESVPSDLRGDLEALGHDVDTVLSLIHWTAVEALAALGR